MKSWWWLNPLTERKELVCRLEHSHHGTNVSLPHTSLPLLLKIPTTGTNSNYMLIRHLKLRRKKIPDSNLESWEVGYVNITVSLLLLEAAFFKNLFGICTRRGPASWGPTPDVFLVIIMTIAYKIFHCGQTIFSEDLKSSICMQGLVCGSPWLALGTNTQVPVGHDWVV